MDPLDPDFLKPVSLLPIPFRRVFPFRYFNGVQTDCFAEAFLSDNNVVISAPTGSGKTVLFELCILRLLGKSLTAEGDFHHVAGARKMMYIAPMKALVQDKVRDWTEKFNSLGVKCQELTSDSGPTNVLDMLDTDMVIFDADHFLFGEDRPVKLITKVFGALSFLFPVEFYIRAVWLRPCEERFSVWTGSVMTLNVQFRMQVFLSFV